MKAEGDTTTLFRWSVSQNSAVAIATELGMIAAYAILGRNSDNVGIAAAIGLLVVPLLAVGVPVYWTAIVERQPLSALGITLRNWFPALVLGIVVTALEVGPLLWTNGANLDAERWLPMAAAGAVSLFEPLFVFGWLQGRFEKDFGVLPAIVLAALCFALYHIGYMPSAMAGEFTSAVVFAVFFRLVNNLLVTWPLLWAATSARICIGGGVCFANWGMVSGLAMALVVELALIAIIVIAQRRTPRAHLRTA